MLLFRCLEVGHVHTATFVISDRPINHGRGSVNAQWLYSAGGLSLWMPGLQPPCSPYFPPTLVPLCCDALKWLSLHALCAHPTLTSFFLPTPIPSLPALGT